MDAPLCTRRGCKQPVRQHRDYRFPKMGPRLIGGQSWNWFCSRRCGGKVLGAGRPADVVRRAAERSAVGRRHAAERRRLDEIGDEVASLVHYGVPPVIARATLLRVSERFEKRGRDAAYYTFVVKPGLEVGSR